MRGFRPACLPGKSFFSPAHICDFGNVYLVTFVTDLLAVRPRKSISDEFTEHKASRIVAVAGALRDSVVCSRFRGSHNWRLRTSLPSREGAPPPAPVPSRTGSGKGLPCACELKALLSGTFKRRSHAMWQRPLLLCVGRRGTPADGNAVFPRALILEAVACRLPSSRNWDSAADPSLPPLSCCGGGSL